MQKKILITFLLMLIGCVQTYAYELILPKEKKSVVTSNYAFFAGRAKRYESITLNDEKVYIAPNGAFAHSVKLKNGENRIVLKSTYNTHIYKFYKSTNEAIEPVLDEFEPRLVNVINDNTPMRSSPVDFGMNRIAHLFSGTNLIVNGQKNGFFRVYLSKNKEGWIAKDSVCECDVTNFKAPEFKNVNSESFKNGSVHTIEMTDKLPYTIDENDREIFFKVYNPFASENSVYNINIRKPDKYYYKISLENGIYTFKVSTIPYCENNSLEGLTIVIDAGHGGSELGAIGCLGDKEKDINLDIATELNNILSSKGAKVIMTRECDAFVSLTDRVKIAKENDADIFVSIHLNSIPDVKFDLNKHKGTDVYYYNENSKDLAKCLEESVTASVKTRKGGIHPASFAVLRPTDYISVLVETAFMVNPHDTMLYKSKDFAHYAAMGIADGISKYVLSY